MTSLRLVSANLLSGRRLDGTVTDAAELTAALAHLAPDVLAVQEVDRLLKRSGLVDQTAAAAAALPSAEQGDYRFFRTMAGAPGTAQARHAPREESLAGAGSRPDPGYGVGLAAGRPVLGWHQLRMAPPPGRFPLPIPSRPPRLLMLPEEPRVVVAAVLADPQITVACAHLSFVPGVNALQLRRVLAWLRELPGPQILLGDLNLPGWSVQRLSRGWQMLVDEPTFPAFGPRVQFDHVLARGLPEGTTFSGSAVKLEISDHLAAVVDLTLPD